MPRVTLMVVLVALVCVSVAGASGYHPDFDRAYAQAELIVRGNLTRLYRLRDENPFPEVDPDKLPRGTFYMDVEKVYKGDAAAGDRIVILDPFDLTSASRYLAAGGPNLMFLVVTDVSEVVAYPFTFNSGTATAEDNDLGEFRTPIYQPIRNLGGDGPFAEDPTGWTRLLELKVDPPEDLLAEYRRIARSNRDDDRCLLGYVLGHWPELPLSAEDVALFRDVVKREAEDGVFIYPAFGVLTTQGETFTADEFVPMLEEWPWYSREMAVEHINAENIDGCREIIWEWLLDDRDISGQQDSTEALARLAPEFLKRKLRETDLPFWQLIPALQALGIDGSAVGKSGYPEGILAVSPYTVRKVGRAYQGDASPAEMLMGDLHETSEYCVREREGWLAALPLLIPALESGDRTTKRAIKGLMHSLGYAPAPKGEQPALRPTEPPVRITLELVTAQPNERDEILVRGAEEAIVDGVWFCFDGETGISVAGPEGTSSSCGPFVSFEESDPPREEFVRLRKGDAVTSEIDIGAYVDRAGSYRLHVSKTYPHDGVDHELDAWNGTIVAEVLEFAVGDGGGHTAGDPGSWADERAAWVNLPEWRFTMFLYMLAGGLIGAAAFIGIRTWRQRRLRELK